jgi:hypothetical protein
MRKLNGLDWITLILLIIGGLNWALVGIWHFNLVVFIFRIPVLVRIVYILVALSAIYMIFTIGRLAKK